MSFRPKTNSFKSDIGTFHMLLGTPFKANLVLAQIGLDDMNTSMGQCFSILESYLYEFEPDGDSDVADYIRNRANLSIRDRWELFGYVDFDNEVLLLDAYLATRDNSHQEIITPDETDAKKKRLESVIKTSLEGRKHSRKLKQKDGYVAVAPPKFDTLYQWDEQLLDRAYHFWVISGAVFPPSIDEVIYRDMDWDDACYEYRYAVDFFNDQKKLKAQGLIRG